MMERKETNKNFLNLIIIACVIILFGFLGGFVSGILDLGETAGIILRTAGLLLLISLGMKLISQHYKKPLTKEMEEEGIKEAEQKDEKQLLFTPTIGVLIFFMIFTLIPAFDIIYSLIKNNVDFGFIASIGIMVFFTWGWYKTPVFIFADDAVQIKSFLFYFFRIDRKTVIRYADIASVGPDPDVGGGAAWGVEPKHRMLITSNGATQNYGLFFHNPDMVAKIYLRFREKLGDRVKIE